MRNKKMQTYQENQEKLSVLLERANEQGEVRIKRANGQIFVLKPEQMKRSALDIDGIDLDVSTDEIVEFVREGRERL
ncbi:MAG: type II toxin-antitoxin system Phd/YefM family antitoxin [Acidobacteriota bacterium]